MTDLADPRWNKNIAESMDLFCPVLSDLPKSDALTLALLPIHDANGILLAALEKTAWPDHAWACVMAFDPFRTPHDLISTLARKGVKRICPYPAMEIMGDSAHAMLEAYNLGEETETTFVEVAIHMGMEVERLRASPLQASLDNS